MALFSRKPKFPQLRFEVASASTGEIYQIDLSRSGQNLTCTCTCPAGSRGTHCKHRVAILCGDSSAIGGGDIDQFDQVARMVEGTDVENSLRNLFILETEKERIAKQIKDAKKALARTLDD
jgi:uncharacterized Zn finger protein